LKVVPLARSCHVRQDIPNMPFLPWLILLGLLPE
jgi:hypothetical protein